MLHHVKKLKRATQFLGSIVSDHPFQSESETGLPFVEAQLVL